MVSWRHRSWVGIGEGKSKHSRSKGARNCVVYIPIAPDAILTVLRLMSRLVVNRGEPWILGESWNNQRGVYCCEGREFCS